VIKRIFHEDIAMESESTPTKPVNWVLRGTVLGAFCGLLIDKFALGMIFGFFIGAAIGGSKRKADEAKPADADREAGI
jgi:F0F1-type ATP synthase assembly protein I